MANRITKKDIEYMVNRINHAAGRSQIDEWWFDFDHNATYGGYILIKKYQDTSESVVYSNLRQTAGAFYTSLRAFEAGLGYPGA